MPDSHPLVCRFGAFGDMVMITPLLRQLYLRSGLPCDVLAIGGWSKLLFGKANPNCFRPVSSGSPVEVVQGHANANQDTGADMSFITVRQVFDRWVNINKAQPGIE